MDEKLLKTSWRQRVFIILITVLLLGSVLATYIGIVVSGSSKDTRVSALEDAYTEAQNEYNTYATELSAQYFDEFSSMKSRVRAYNAESINNTGVASEDLKEGTGRELTTGDLEYYAYYIGWCSDETVFDSSFDSFENPTALKAPIYAGQGLIEGWNTGVVGMKIGGIREIQIPGELAYADTQEICGGYNSPLKFVVMAVEDSKLTELTDKITNAYYDLVNAYYSQQ